MSFIITFLNFVGVLFLYNLNYRLVEGLDRFDTSKEISLNYFLFIFIAITVYKIIMFYIYNIKWSIFYFKHILFSDNISIFFKILVVLGLLLDISFLFGISFIFFKVFLIEWQINLTGSIPLLGLLKYVIPSESNYYIYRFRKRSFYRFNNWTILFIKLLFFESFKPSGTEITKKY